MKNIFSQSLKTTIFGVGSIVCLVLPLFLPAAAPVCAKLATLLGGLGLVAAQDQNPPDSPSRSSNKLNSWFILPLIVLGVLAVVTVASARISQYQPTTYRVFVGEGDPNTNTWATASGTGSFFINNETPETPVLWVKATTNGFVLLSSSSSVSNVFWADDAGHAVESDHSAIADSASYADAASFAGDASRAGSADRLYSQTTGNFFEFRAEPELTYVASGSVSATAFRTDYRTNVISIKPSAVAAFNALVPGGLVTNSVPLALPGFFP